MKKLLPTIVLASVLGAALILSGGRLVTLLKDVPPVVARVNKQVESVRPARLKVMVVNDSSCSNCASTEPFVEALKKQRVLMNPLQKIDGAAPAGKKYLAAQKIERYPAVVVTGETSHHAELKQFLSQTSTAAKNGFVYYAPPPYHDVASDKVRGDIQLTYLMSAECKDCYDVANNALALQNLGITVASNNKAVTAESSEGQKLVEQYKIQYLPTILLTGDLEVYSAFQSVWPRVGSREADGTYILRDGVKLMGTYYDRQLKRSVVPPKPANSSP